MSFEENLNQLKITAEKILNGKKKPEESLPVYSGDFNNLLEVLKDIEVDLPTIELTQEITEGDTENAPSSDAVFKALEEVKNDIFTSDDITNDIWDFAGPSRQIITADSDKTITIENPTDSVKVLQIINTGVQRTITITNKSYIIEASTSKITLITGTYVNGELYLSDSEVFNKVSPIDVEFPTENRIGLWTMSSLVTSGSNVVSWEDADGGGNPKKWIRASSPGPVYSSGDGVSFTNNINMHRDPEGLTLGLQFTMYALIKKTGDGSLMALYTNPYFLYMTNSTVGFNSGLGTSQLNISGIENMSDYKVLALKYESGNSAAKLFVDGIMVGSFTPTLTETEETKLYFMYASGDPFAGFLKGFTFFSEAHSDLDIAINSPLFKTLAES